MRYLIVTLLFSTLLFGFAEGLESFKAEFEQRIVDNSGKSVLYRGSIAAKKPGSVLWHYTEPVEKEIYVQRSRVVVIEPELEQAIVKDLDEEIDFFTILSHAKAVDAGHYEAHYASQSFRITADKETIGSIDYTDGYDNKVELRFFNQERNPAIEPDTFRAKIPDDYDVIR